MSKINNNIFQDDLGKKIGNEIMKTAKDIYKDSFRGAVEYYGMFRK